MKKWFYLVVVFLFSCAEEINTEVTSTYPNGNKREQITFKGVNSHLISTQLYYINGQLASENSYQEDGKTKNFQTEYYENGTVKIQGELKNDERFGVWKAYFPSGEIQTLANYNKNGKQEGMYYIYRKTSNAYYIWKSGYYKDGEKRGLWNTFNKDSVVINTESFTKTP